MSTEAERQPESPPAVPETVAAVDLGSNSFHMIVARTTGGQPVVVDRIREMVQLAAGLDDRRRIDDDAQERAIACLKRFGERLRHMAEGAVRAVGTNTLRRARARSKFLERAEEALGHPIETISGVEEARLVYLGAESALPRADGGRLVVDIGGGSTELILGRDGIPERMESLYMGCVSHSRTYFRNGKLTERAWRRAILAALQELEPVQKRFRATGWKEVVGTSGTIRTIGEIVRNQGWSKGEITAKSLARLRDHLTTVATLDDLALEGLSVRRRSVFPGGVAVLLAVFESLGLTRMVACDGALREGLLVDLVGRFRGADVRDRSVRVLADRYHVDWEQAGRIERSALALQDAVADSWNLSDPAARRMLSWAARLHEIGLDIAHAHYHRHGEYIVAQADLPGFSTDEQRRLATLVRAHRRRFPTAAFREIRRRRETERLAILLRIAVLLHRSRGPEDEAAPRINGKKRTLRLEFPEGWLDEHPLTRADLEEESRYLEGEEIDLQLQFA